MAYYQAPLRDMRFVLNEVLEAGDEWAAMPATAEVTPDLADAILEEGARVTRAELFPLNQSGDAEGCRFEGGRVNTPSGFKAALRTLADGGWLGLGGNPDHGGQGLPKLLTVAFEEMLYATNASFALYPALNTGATLLLDQYAPESIKRVYLPRMYAGEWLGTMCLTEPHCGTDLGLIKTRAVPLDKAGGEGPKRYAITGSKIWITGGEHDMVDNIVHLVLAKLPNAPPGTKGISLFLVPKYRVNADGEPDAPNGVSCGGLEHKMGIQGSATCVMHFEGAEGVLIGEPHQGLAAMFTMMNYERLSIGLQGLGLGEVAHQSAMDFARERRQSRAPGGAKAPDADADPILVHPDVRRMALNARAWNEGGRAFAAFVASQLDRAKFHADTEVRDEAEALVALLTPVAKAFLTDRGFDTTVESQQLYGGSGYCVEWGAEQYVRDARIAMIYEGTNGIQAMDLVGRKLFRNQGRYVKRFASLMQADLGERPDPALADAHTRATLALVLLENVTVDLLQRAKNRPEELGAAAADYLSLFGHVAYAWMWWRMMRAAQHGLETQGPSGEAFYRAKLAVGRHYLTRMLPRIEALERQIEAGAEPLMALPEEAFHPQG
ncbi:MULTISPECIES: acyl-CoA dehydrogenase C-terminal domain-containing protein [unclassified Modicisalibacter]|uniref:acyl-CoA dehydrogenase C-terminal domain-containing protein n=1 Tax=unclassified Modicisalibacter TaxID=2679913 RepID=UPI001CCC5FFB|nr:MULTISPECIES: acyl-CoA dehydrogenase C-terminal domain-containing protein [unclassified Modicisalibacter]MBZ9557131.1 acyl-CoA dehydrogenase C-terminal domain-containing protein [Modicisalibacter sp. R2A 31.J]MBZ9574155.1 acyl-CoA dehydrogenase C-terminal domain-containing protein [Modicisalibacter sp. MOD 31.J]